MPPLYVIQQGAKLRLENRRLRVELDGEMLDSIPLAHLSQVVLFGNISLTTPAMGALMDQGIEVIFLTQDGAYRGRLVGSVTPHVPLRRAQYSRLNDPGFVLAMAKGFVEAKLRHQRTLLQRHNRAPQGSGRRDDPEIVAACDQIGQAIEAIPRRTALSALLGLEGSATAAYFRGLRRLFDPAWNFSDRNRRPPRDPVNVLLSFGYTLLLQLASSAVQAVGLDPFAGFLHEVAYNRPALGLDLMEEFRPVVDGIVLWCCNSGQVTLNDFIPGDAERPLLLTDPGRRRFLQAFENRLDQRMIHPGRGQGFPLRQCLVEQARQIAERITAGNPGYLGMGFR